MSIGKATTDVYPVQLRRLIGQFLPSSGLPLIVQDQRLRWTPRLLALTAILLHLLPGVCLQGRFQAARDAVVAMYGTRRRPGKTYAGFIQTLTAHSDHLLEVLAVHFRRRLPELFHRSWRIGGRVVFAVDGTRIECPRTRANEKAMGCAGRKKTGPQRMLTTIFHLGSGLVWAWGQGDGKRSERSLLRQMLSLLPGGSWLLGDAGFGGYALFQQMRRQQIHFIIRVGSNVRLLKKLGFAVREYEGLVYLWPQKQQERKSPPLILRLLRVRSGKQVVCLLISELDAQVLSDQEAMDLYRRRWLVEVNFRALKRTVGRHRMESDSPAAAAVELDWAVTALWVLQMVMVREEVCCGRTAGSWSVALALRVVHRASIKGLRQRCSMRRLREELRRCVKDQYRRHSAKARRRWPRKKTEAPPGQPDLSMASKREIALTQRLKELRHAA